MEIKVRDNIQIELQINSLKGEKAMQKTINQ